MRVKRYEAETMQEVIMKVRSELGRDAVILHSKKFRRGGAFGLFGRPMFEVIAAVELPGEAQGRRPEKRTQEQAGTVALEGALAVGQGLPAPGVAATTPAPIHRYLASEPVVRGPEAVPSPERRATAAVTVAMPEVRVGKVTVPVVAAGEPAHVAPIPVRSADTPAASASEAAHPALAEELAGLRRMMHELSSQLSAQGTEVVVAPGWETVRQRLLDEGLRPEYVAEVEAEVFRGLGLEELQEEEPVAGVARRYFLKHFMVERRKLAQPGTRRVVALVGPTGVGKTTTVAKLAAQYSLFGNHSVGLLTVDTYRIAAVDQLKTYAEIINLPVEVAFSPQEVKEALARLSDREIILLDTAGRSQKNDAQMDELRAYLDAAKPDEVHLVLSTTTKQRDLDDCLAQFHETGFRQLIFTKLDETDAYGAIFNCAREARCPITYLTFGQNVPDDIEEASQERLADLLIGAEAWKR
jgi:flagellar biosynthesis protein FlhF